MPRVSREKWPFEGEDFYRVINVSTKGVFSIRVPQPVIDALGISFVEADTKAGAIKKFIQKIEDYKATKTTVRKVIVYRFECKGETEDECGDLTTQFSDISFAEGLVLSAWAVVCEETQVNSASGKIRYDYDELESSILRSMEPKDRTVSSRGEAAENVIDWTPAREEFFVKLGQAMMGLITKMKAFEPTDKLIERIDAGLLLEG